MQVNDSYQRHKAAQKYDTYLHAMTSARSSCSSSSSGIFGQALFASSTPGLSNDVFLPRKRGGASLPEWTSASAMASGSQSSMVSVKPFTLLPMMYPGMLCKPQSLSSSFGSLWLGPVVCIVAGSSPLRQLMPEAGSIWICGGALPPSGIKSECRLPPQWPAYKRRFIPAYGPDAAAVADHMTAASGTTSQYHQALAATLHLKQGCVFWVRHGPMASRQTMPPCASELGYRKSLQCSPVR